MVDAFAQAQSVAADAAALASAGAAITADAAAELSRVTDVANALVADATQRAHALVADALAALGQVTVTMNKAVDKAVQALNSAKDAVVEFGQMVVSGFFGSISSLFSYARSRQHISAFREFIDRHDEAAETIAMQQYGQSHSPTQSRPLQPPMRHLLAFGVGDIGKAFHIVYKGIEGQTAQLSSSSSSKFA